MNVLEPAPAVDPAFQVADRVNPATVFVVPILAEHQMRIKIPHGLYLAEDDVILLDGLIEPHGQVATQVVAAHPRVQRPT